MNASFVLVALLLAGCADSDVTVVQAPRRETAAVPPPAMEEDPCAIRRETVDHDEDAQSALDEAMLDCKTERAKLIARGLGENHPSVSMVDARERALETSRASWSRWGGGAVAYRYARLREREACVIASGKGEHHPAVLDVRAQLHVVEAELPKD